MLFLRSIETVNAVPPKAEFSGVIGPSSNSSSLSPLIAIQVAFSRVLAILIIDRDDYPACSKL